MEQRTNSRLSSSARGSGLQGNEQAQKSPLPGLAIGQSDLPTAFINAPTSLTNLAQLSGISLVPINERRTTLNLSSNNSQIISFNGHQQPKITVNPRSRQNQPANIQIPPAVINNHNRDPTYNLNIIPSIQLLNRVTIDHQRGSRVATLPPRTVNLKPKKAPATSHLHPQTHLETNNVNHRTFQGGSKPGPQSTNRSRASTGSSNRLTIPCTLDQQPLDNDSLQISRPESPAIDGADNISLLRLMAIFNNPALTITPVGPTSTTAPIQLDNNSRASISAVSSDRARYPPQQAGSNSHRPAGNRFQTSDLHDRSEIFKDQYSYVKEVQHSLDGYGAIAAEIEESDTRVIDHRDQHIDQSSLSNGLHTVTLSWSPNNKANNNPVDPDLKTSPPSPTDPEGLSEGLVVDGQENHPSYNVQHELVQEKCMTLARKVNLKPLVKVAKRKITSHLVFSKHDEPKPTKPSIISTKRRLYIPRAAEKVSTKKVKLAPNFNDIEVETIEQDDYVSEHHSILAKIDEIAESRGLARTIAPISQNDISAKPADRLMSTIDAIIREFENRFESPSQMEEDDEVSLIKYEFETQSPLVNEVLVLPIQLPLEEEPTKQKKEHLSLLGLVSRNERHKIIARQSVERIKNFSSLDECDDFSDVNGEVRRIVETLIQTGGDKINLRTDTDIKRNELPFIEGLNRNTSRIKMTFMNALGLEKRSKRTTLYKVVKPQEVMAGNSFELKAHNDLSNTVKNINFNKLSKTKYPVTNASPKPALPIATTNQTTGANHASGPSVSSINTSGGSAEILRRAIKLAQASCREALHKAPNKDEYMKSLGLMAS